MSKKISTLVNEDVWDEFKGLSRQHHQNLTGMLNEAIREYIQRRKLRPKFIRHMENSIADNNTLGRLLAK
ncbi:MAG: hypothetical protein ACD_62C00294G0002 [uncultured bacterium]|nr:MAG: hypothetical protein ACD_62C00294G0002 [uncultured bacterium]HLD44659.1 hypothetical protein [bacterium]